MEITSYDIRHFDLPRERTIGDSQIEPIGRHEVGYLELETDVDITGVGVDTVNFGGDVPLPSGHLAAQFEPLGNELKGRNPASALHQQSRGRGGEYGAGQFDRMVDFALWDLVAKYHEIPLYELLGASEGRVDAYASGLAFHHDDSKVREIYERFSELGFTDAKVKVGFESVEEDIERIELVDEVLDGCRRLMVDANEAFAPKQAIRRVRAYRDAGFDIYWIEDPVARTNIQGILQVAEALPDTYMNVGEYVDLAGKRRLLESGAVDILNVHGVSSGREAATMAHTYGAPLSVGNTPVDLGAHVAAALPECGVVEYSMSAPDILFSGGVEFEDGQAVLPERPGHGLTLDDDSAPEYERTSGTV
jgi:L-alanine-DL-glutamate epimerase-like enolase superfamily enzyme